MCPKKIRLSRSTSKANNASELEQDLQELENNYQMLRMRKYAKIFLIGFFIGRDTKNKINELKAKIKKKIRDKILQISQLTQEIKASGTYLIYPKKSLCLSSIDSAKLQLAQCEKCAVFSTKFIGQMSQILYKSEQLINSYNDNFVKQRKADYKYLWVKGTIFLDDEQQTAIVTDDKYNLVVAAAGSGKTEVLTTRIAYLIERKPDGIESNRILAIAYQRKAKDQIEQRLRQRYGIEEVNVKTFHKLGKGILELSGQKIERTDIVDENKKFSFIKSYFEGNITNPEFYQLFFRYIKTVHDKEDESVQSDKDAAVTYAREHKYVTLDGTKVNSYAEKEIMDYLLTQRINGRPIEVQYEPDLEGFRPDFYLPQFDVFIEHWGIDKDGKVPKWFSQSSEEYQAIMEKKRAWFSEHHRLLMETYSHEYNVQKPELFCELIREKLQKTLNKPLIFTPFTYEELLNLVWESQKTPIDDIEHFITIAKTYGLNPDDIARKLVGGRWGSKQLTFGILALNVFRAYDARLKQLGKIDFEDMINEASVALDNNANLCRNIYDHILVDEYQDISAQRLTLLKKILERNPDCKLFCVGDDWQSIMGFSGSNLNYFVKFSDFFENPAVSQICTNYRSIKPIVNTGAELIKHNGNKQIQKKALSKRTGVTPVFVLGSPHQETFDTQYFNQICEDCLSRISAYLEKGYSMDDILVLTRFMRTKIGGRTQLFKVVQTFYNLARAKGIEVAVDNAKKPNAIKLLTVHKCKGLEARVVFVLNVVSGEFGFPSEIEDPSILEVARGDNGIEDRVEEERRLFYVAITRAKEDLYIYTRLNAKSQFLDEIADGSQSIRLNY